MSASFRSLYLSLAIGLALAFVILAAAALLGPQLLSGSASQRQTTLDYLGTPLGAELAKDFRLTDQKGQAVGLSDFRGKVVLLTFLAPECTDVCPLTAREFLFASSAVEEAGQDVALIAVNTNVQRPAIPEMAEASKKWGVDELPNWHYLTGGPLELEGVWKSYNIFSGVPKVNKPQEIDHTSGVYVIDQSGRLRWFVSVPFGEPGFRPLSEILVQRVLELRR